MHSLLSLVTSGASSGSGGVSGTGTTGKLIKFTGAGQIGDSVLSESGVVVSQRDGVNAQESRVYGTYTDASNGRWLRLDTTTGGANVIAAEGNGTGVAANTLQLAVNTLAALDIAADGDATFNYDLNAASGNVLTRIRTLAGAAPAVVSGTTAGNRTSATLSRTTIGTGDVSIAMRIEVPTANPTATVYAAAFSVDSSNRWLVFIDTAGSLVFRTALAGVSVPMSPTIAAVSRYPGQVIDYAVTRSGTLASVYINGTLAASQTIPELAVNFTSAATLDAGGVAGAGGYTSRIYNTQLYTRALSAADCADLAQKGINPADQWVDGSALYTSDFSAGVDGWAGAAGTLTGNIDGISGLDNNLRWVIGTGAIASDGVYKAVLPVGKRVRVTYQYYLPAGQTQISALRTVFGATSVVTGQNTSDAWTTVTVEGISTSTSLFIGIVSFTGTGNGTDLFYIRNVTVTPIGCALSWRYLGPGPTFADDSSNAYIGLGVGVSQTLPSSGGTYSYEARFLASAISTSAGTTKLIDLPANSGVMNVEILRNSAMDAAVTLDVGTSGTAAKYASAMAMDATGLLFADSLSKGSESATAITPLYIKKSGATTVGDITVRITIQARS